MADELEKKIATKSFKLYYAHTVKRQAIIEGDIIYCVKDGAEKVNIYDGKGRYVGCAFNPPIGNIPPPVSAPNF